MLNDVIKKYDLAFKNLETSQNPKVQLTAIIDFFKYLEEKKQYHLFKKFIGDFLKYLINIYKNSTIDFIDPEYFVVSRYLLKKAIELENNEIVIKEIKTVIDLINIRLLVTYYYLGEIKNGLIILKDILNSNPVMDSGVSLDNRKSVNIKYEKKKHSLVDPNIFKVNKVFYLLRRINYELKRINSYSYNSVNILLVETDNLNNFKNKFGTIQSLDCDIEIKRDRNLENPVIDNTTDIHTEGIHTIRNDLFNATNKFLNYFGVKLNKSKAQVYLRFSDLKSIYKGISYGFGAAIVIASQYLIHINSRNRFKISNSAAFTGSIDENGNLLKLPDESIITKIETAFFSWIKYVIIPKENYNSSLDKMNELNKKYPGKRLYILGINNISELQDCNNIIIKEKDNLIEHTKKTVKKHQAISNTLFSIILILLTAFSVNKLISKKLKPLPVTSQQLNMIYAPDRDTVWKFISADRAGGDTIFFGETAIGDIWYHKLDLWNNDNNKNPLRIRIEGLNKDEFELIWGLDLSQKEAPDYIYPDVKEKLFIKFVPYKREGGKNAKLVFYNENEKTITKEIFLRGNAGYYKNGYSLKLKDDDEFIINPKGNVLQNEFTITYWFKPNKSDISLLQSETQNWTQTKFNSRINKDSTLSFGILNSKMAPHSNYYLNSKSKTKINDWNFIAISHFNNITQIIFNDEQIDFKTEANHFLQTEDLFYFGDYHPIRRSEYDATNDNRELLISELRMYKNKLATKEILNKKYIKENPDDNRLILYYDFDEASGKAVWDKTKNDVFAELYALPGRSLDYPPIFIKDKISESKENTDNFLKISGKGQIILNKNLFIPNSDFTIQFEAKMEGDYKNEYRIFSDIVYYESISYNWHLINGDSIKIFYRHPLFPGKDLANIKKSIDGLWHRYTLDYSFLKKRGRFFIDGELTAVYNMDEFNFDFSQNIFFILFGNTWCYDNPRFIGFGTSIDNISIINKLLDSSEIKLSDPIAIKNIKGLLAFWSLNKIKDHLCFDDINNYPIFIWEDYEILKK